MNLHTHRRHRRRAKSALRNKDSVRKHQRKSGRTGSIKSKRNPSAKLFPLKVTTPNPPIGKV